jgi:quinol monooxygenase YgiN
MIGVIAVLRVQADKFEAFEAAFAKLADQVRGQEHGNLLYRLTRSRTEPGVYKVMELYADDHALKTHGETDYFKAAGAALAPCLTGPMEIEYLDVLD